jgi:hypothetical protein
MAKIKKTLLRKWEIEEYARGKYVIAENNFSGFGFEYFTDSRKDAIAVQKKLNSGRFDVSFFGKLRKVV